MRLTLQRVTSANVRVNGSIVSSIGKGLVCFVGICHEDTEEDVIWSCKKILNIRLWPNADNKQWNNSLLTNSYEVLLISQFTLHAYLNGNKPDFHLAMKSTSAKIIFENLINCVKKESLDPNKVFTGVFGADMSVALENDGPVTINLDSKDKKKKKDQL